MKLTRWIVTAAAALALVGPAAAECKSTVKAPWQAQVKEARFGLTTPETNTTARTGFSNFETYICGKLGIPAKVFNATDYNGVAQAMDAGQIDIAMVGPSNYAQMWLQSKGGVEPILTNIEVDGSKGYFSVLYVKASSPYKTLNDLKGKIIAYADVNSTSGYLFPRHAMRERGINPDKFFGKTIFAGGHEQGVVAVVGGQADAGVVWSSAVGDAAKGYSRGIFTRMVDQKLLKMSDIRIIEKFGPIVNGPVVIRSALPKDYKAALAKALMDLPKENPAAYRALASGDSPGFTPVTHKDYELIVKMRQDEEKARRQRR
jgi:phosphonate transport system substrate-binding protein